jgi:hypothetical protein
VHPEGACTNGKTTWYPADAVVCLSCDQKKTGTEQIVAGDDDGSSSTIQTMNDDVDDVGADASNDDGGDSATSGTKNDDTEIAGENVDDGAASTEQQNSNAGQKGEGVAHLKKMFLSKMHSESTPELGFSCLC